MKEIGRSKFKIIAIFIIFMLSLGMLSSCKKAKPQEPSSGSDIEASDDSQDSDESEQEASSDSSSSDNSSSDSSDDGDADSPIPEDGLYNSKDDVALYLYTYGHLPSNYITKKEAQNLGWTGGSVEKYGDKLAIGGDSFGNYEGSLPDGTKYHECDIDTWGKSKRGAKRIVWSDEGNIYYTEDHYESFELLYGEE